MEYRLPEINNKKDLKSFLRPLYIIEDYTCDTKTYSRFCDEIRDILRACFTIKECREYPVRFKFYATDEKEQKLELRHFLYNVYVWYAMCQVHGIHVMNEDFILKPEEIPDLTDFTNNKIDNCFCGIDDRTFTICQHNEAHRRKIKHTCKGYGAYATGAYQC